MSETDYTVRVRPIIKRRPRVEGDPEPIPPPKRKHRRTRPIDAPKPEPRAPKNENDVRNAIQKMAMEYGAILWRNNSGAFQDKAGHYVRFGLGNISKKANDEMKSSDLIGVGLDGKFIAIEVKEPFWKWKGDARETAQKYFIDCVRLHGGIGFFANSVDAARVELEKWYKRLC